MRRRFFGLTVYTARSGIVASSAPPEDHERQKGGHSFTCNRQHIHQRGRHLSANERHPTVQVGAEIVSVIIQLGGRIVRQRGCRLREADQHLPLPWHSEAHGFERGSELVGDPLIALGGIGLVERWACAC